MTGQTPAPTVVRVEYDQACIQCGYQLRDLPVTGVCPECGTPVARSFRGDRLSAAEPRYVRSLHEAAILLTGAAVIPLLTLIGFVSVATIADIEDRAPQWLWTALLIGAAVLTAGVTLLGVFRLSARDPDHLGGMRLETGRALARPGVVAGAAGLIIAATLESLAMGGGVLAAAAIAVGMLGAGAAAAGTALLLSSIARRSADRALSRRLRNLVIMACVAAGLDVLSIAGGVAGVGASRSVQVLAGLVALVTLFLALGFLDELRTAMRQDLSAATALRASR